MSHKKRNINLKSILIGNGLTDGLTQYGYYRPMAGGDGGWPAVVEESQCQGMDNALPRWQSLIEGCYNSESVWSCVPAAIYCNNAIIGPYQRTGQNPYDVRVPCEDGSLCYSQLTWINKWLNKPEVMEGLGVEVDTYDGCNFDVNRNFLFAGDWMMPFHRLVPGILEKMPILIYAVRFLCLKRGHVLAFATHSVSAWSFWLRFLPPSQFYSVMCCRFLRFLPLMLALLPLSPRHLRFNL